MTLKARLFVLIIGFGISTHIQAMQRGVAWSCGIGTLLAFAKAINSMDAADAIDAKRTTKFLEAQPRFKIVTVAGVNKLQKTDYRYTMADERLKNYYMRNAWFYAVAGAGLGIACDSLVRAIHN